MAGNSHHGNTPAAWTGVLIAFIGFCVAGGFMVVAQPWGVVLGLVIVCAGGLVGMALSAAGLGVRKAGKSQRRATSSVGS